MDAYPVTEFEAIIEDDGSLRLPKELQQKMLPGATVIVRLVEGHLTSMLRSRGVTEEEIETISRLQMEQRGDVIRFLETEGAFSSNRSFAKRVQLLIA